MAYTVRDATKLHGVGLFGGYNIFLNQRIKVCIYFENDPISIHVDDVKKLVNKSLKSWSGWTSSDNIDELQIKIKEAKTIKEIVVFLYEEQEKSF